MLTGKHSAGDAPPAGRFTLGTAGKLYQDRYWHEREFETVGAFCRLADEARIARVTAAVGWVLAHPAITSAIVGASRPEQLADSLAAVDKPLAPSLKTALDELSQQYRFGDAAR